MSTHTLDVARLHGRSALDRNGRELGPIDGVYLDRETSEPEWAAVRTGDDATRIVPLAGAVVTDQGITLAFDEALVRGAPITRGPLPPEVPPQLEAELYHYFSLDYTGSEPSPQAEQQLPSGPAGAG